MALESWLTPTTLLIIAAVTALEGVILMRWFARKKDDRNVGITLGNSAAGIFLMGALASEMAEQTAWVTAVCLLGALIAHVAEVWLRLR